MSDGLYNDIRRLLELLYADNRERAPGAALVLLRLFDGEPVGRLAAELIRQSVPTIPPPADLSPIPDTLPTGARGTPGRPPKGTP